MQIVRGTIFYIVADLFFVGVCLILLTGVKTHQPDHYILSREWRVIVDQVQTHYHGKPIVL